MRIRRRYAVILALAAAGAVAVAGIAIAAPTSTYDFKFTPNKVPKKKYKGGAFSSVLDTSYTNPGNSNPGGAVERTQIYLDKNWKINPKEAKKCSASQLSNQTMAGAMAACKKAKVGKGIATANANGAFIINGCVLLFNGKPQGGKPTLQVFTRVQASNPSNISCSDPSHNTQAAQFPLELFDTKIKKDKYFSARCKAKSKKWKSKTKWTYNDGTTLTDSGTQKCKVKH